MSDVYGWHEIKHIAEKNGIDRNTYTLRRNVGMDQMKAATQPKRKRKHDDEFYEYTKIAKNNGIHPSTFESRVKKGMDYKTAATLPLKFSNKSRHSRKDKEYSIYENDKEVFTGTAEECAEFRGIKLESFLWYLSPSSQDRQATRKNPEKAMHVVDLGSDDDE